MFGLVMVIFVATRPFGIARDDVGYLAHYNSICPTIACEKWFNGGRDIGWNLLVGLLKNIIDDPRIMLWLSAAGLLIKLFVIKALTKRPLIVLLCYTSLYYQVQDLTSFRVSLSIAFFMLAIWLIVRTSCYWNAPTLLISGFFHKQAYVAPLILFGLIIKKSRWLLNAICFIAVIMLLLDFYPQWHLIVFKFGDRLRDIVLNIGLDVYVGSKLAGVYLNWRQAPIVYYPQILMILWLINKTQLIDEKLDSMLTGCLVMACIFLWGFASLPDAQVRFFEFFMVPTLLIVGMRRLKFFELSSVIFVSGLFVAKFNIIHQLVL